MFYKEENIVNISMIAAQLLKEGRIERDDMSGHAGLTEVIIELAEQFENENSGVDYNTSDRDYWEEIDAFAERELIARYGIDNIVEQSVPEIKVIIYDGIIESVLTSSVDPVNIEIVSIDEDYEDYDQLKDYRDKLYSNDAFKYCDYSVSHFDEDEPYISDTNSLDSKISDATLRYQVPDNEITAHLDKSTGQER